MKDLKKDVPVLGYEIEGSLLSLYVLETDRFSKLLSLRGFECIKKRANPYAMSTMDGELTIIKIDTSEYFDVDRFMDIVDILNYSNFVRLSTSEVDINREDFVNDLLAIV